ncbi:MAG: exo-alpha-sialidase [Firmicutes bacterium]|nr:exo-alpha-sialidase [Bacillota bacterium]
MYEVVFREFLFNNERPFNSCHASTLVVLGNGDLLAAWFGGSQEGASDVAIWLSRRDHAAQKWGLPLKVADKLGVPHWNPVLFHNQDGTLLLFYKVGHQISKWQTFVKSSNDGGLSWTKALELVPGDCGGRGPVRSKPIALANGTVLAPASIENDHWNAFVDISHDSGLTWDKSEMVPLKRSASGTSAPDNPGQAGCETGKAQKRIRGKGVIQPTLWESEPGQVHMLLRSTEGVVYRSDSADGGKTWCLAYPTELPNNNSGIDLVKLHSGLLALVYNPVGINWGPRTPLVLALSCDNGVSWGKKLVLEDDEGEYSYPAVVSSGDMVYITYTWRRERICCWGLKINE